MPKWIFQKTSTDQQGVSCIQPTGSTSPLFLWHIREPLGSAASTNFSFFVHKCLFQLTAVQYKLQWKMDYKIYKLWLVIYTVVRPALWICGGKPCSFHIRSLPSNIKAKLPAAGNFSLKQRVKTSKLVNFTLKV